MSPTLDYNVVYINKKSVGKYEDYETVSHDRWKNAVNCYNNGDYLAALYLAGYSVECILKFVILTEYFSDIKNLNIDMVRTYKVDGKDFKPLGEHKLNKLITLGNTKNIFKTPKEADFQEVVLWKSEWRYATSHNIDKDKALHFLESVVDLSKVLKNELSGKIRIKAFQL